LNFAQKHDSYNGFSVTELKDIFATYVDKNNAMVAYRPIVTMLDKLNQAFLKEELAKAGNPEFHLEWITPVKELDFVIQRDDAIEIGNEIKKLGLDISSKLPEAIENRIAEHIKRFGWLFTHHFLGEPMTRDDILITVEKLMEGGYDPEKIAVENASRNASLDKVKAINSNISRHIEVAQDYAYMRS